MSIISMVYTLYLPCIKVRLHTAISRVNLVSWWMLQTYKGNKMYLSENDAVLISVCEPLNYIHQDTKSARLIAVCRRSITTDLYNTTLYYSGQ